MPETRWWDQERAQRSGTMETVRKLLETMPALFVLHHKGVGRTAIQCLVCGFISHNQNDVANRYCGYCKLFLEDARKEAVAIQQTERPHKES